MAFAQKNRLRKSSLIQLVCKKGASWKTPFFRIKFLPARHTETQIVIVPSKKVDKRAVYRNKIRRKLCAAFEEIVYDESNSIQKKYIIVIFPTEKILLSTHKELVKAGKFSFKKIEEKRKRKY